MEIRFNDTELALLYENKKVKNKAFVSNPQLVKQYIKTINLLKGAIKIEHLQQFKSLNYHKLSGDLDGLSTVYVNKQFRVVFQEIASEEPPFEITILQIEELKQTLRINPATMSIQMKQLTPGFAIHPGEHLKDELEARGLSQHEFANLLGMKRSQLNEIIKGKPNINAELALLIGQALEIDAEFWLSLQSNYELDEARIDVRTRERMADIELWNRVVKPNFAVNFLKKQGVLTGNPTEDISQVKKIYNISTFDNVGNIYANKYARYRKSEKHETDEVNLLGWAKLVSFKADSQVAPRFDHTQQNKVLEKANYCDKSK